MASLTQRVVRCSVAWRWLLLGLALLITVTAIGPAGQVEFDRSVENMFAPDDPVLAPYQRLKRTFGGNEIILAVYVDPDHWFSASHVGWRSPGNWCR